MAYQLQEINRRIQSDVKEFLAECDENYSQRVSLAADKILSNIERSPIVLLSGPSGSGKTTTAMKIAEELQRRGVNTHAVAMDNYFTTINPRTAPRTAKRHSIGNQIHQHRQAVCHITGQIAAVSTGIGAELLFIQALQIVQGLLGRKSKQAVGISLQSSQVIKGRWLFGLFLALHLFDCDICTLTGFFQLFGSSFIRHALPGYGKTGQLQRDGIKGNRLKGVDLSLSLDNERQRWRHHAPDVEGAVVQHGKKPCSIDPYQPVGLGTAESSIPKSIIIYPWAQVCKALPYGGVLHRRNPEAFHGLLAACQLVDAAELDNKRWLFNRIRNF